MDPNTASPTCTVGGICGQSANLLAIASAAAAPKAAAPATAGAAAAASAAAAAAPRPAPTAPNITLNGPVSVEFTAGTAYDRCASNAPLGTLCDRGATAVDALDGPLERTLFVCGSQWQTSGGVRAVPVLMACGINGDVPGEYNLLFTAINTAGLTNSVTRRLVIKAKCPAGETLCGDKVSCSEGGSCMGRGRGAGADAGPTGSAAVAASVAASAPVQPNKPPMIQLKMADGVGNVVYVRRVFGVYAACQGNQTSSAQAPCEPGATASDPDGGANGGALDITGQVVVCPPDACLAGLCSSQDLRKHYFSVKVRRSRLGPEARAVHAYHGCQHATRGWGGCGQQGCVE